MRPVVELGGFGNPRPDLRRLVFDQVVGGDPVALLFEKFLDQLSAGISVWSTSIATCNDHAAHAPRSVGLVFVVSGVGYHYFQTA